MNLDKVIQSRHSVRKFSDKKPNWRDIVECIDATRYTPMAGNSFTLKFIVVNDSQSIQKIADATQQTHVSQVQYIVVVCSRSIRATNAYGKRGEKYLRQQAGAAIQTFLLKIQEKGLGACWVGHFVDSMIKEELKIPDDVDIEAVIPVGYEYKKPKTRRMKIDIDRILYFYKYKNKKMKNIKTLDV